MNRKLLISGFCLLFGLCILLIRHWKLPAVASTEGMSGLVTKYHFSSDLLSLSPNARLSDDARRADLIRKIDAILDKGELVDSERISSLLVQLMEIDPAEVAEYTKELARGPLREDILRRVSLVWASKDPASAERWAAALPVESERWSALENICLQISRNDGALAMNVAEKHELEVHSAAVMENLAQQWAARDFPAAAAWIRSRPADGKREEMIMRLAFMRAETQPAEAGRLVVEEIPEGPVQTEAVISVIHQWGKRDMAGARDWIALFPEGQLRDRAESELENLASFGAQNEGQAQ